MARISPELKAFITDRLPGGLDDREVADIARKVTTSASPLATLDAVLAGYGDRFTVDGAQAFGVAARVLGDDDLADVADVFETTRRAVAETRVTIQAVKGEIQGLEATNRAKSAQIDTLIRSIDSRKTEIKNERENKRNVGFAAALLGMPMISAVSLIKMQEDDGRLQQLSKDKAQAEASRGQLDGKIAAHTKLTESLQGRLQRLERAEQRIGPDMDVPTPEVAKSFVAVAQSAAKLSRREKLLENLQQQLSILKEIRGSAADLGNNLDGVIEDLEAKVVRADKMVKTSQDSFNELIRIATAKDPEATAEKWLNKRLATKTKALMRDLKRDMHSYIDHLVKGAFPDGGPAAAALKKQLKASLLSP